MRTTFQVNVARSRSHRRVVAGLAGIGLALVIACWSASAAGLPNVTPPPLPSLPSVPSLVPSPTLSAVTNGVLSGPSPTAAAGPAGCTLSTPAGLTSPTPTPTPTPSGSGQAPTCPLPTNAVTTPTNPFNPPPATPTGVPGVAMPSGAQSNAAPVAVPLGQTLNQAGLFDLLSLLGTPAGVGVEAPALQHFGHAADSQGTVVLTGDASTAASLTSAPTAPHQVPALLWLAIGVGLAGLLVSVSGTVLARRLRLNVVARITEMVAVPCALAVVGGSVAAVPLSGAFTPSISVTPAAAQVAKALARPDVVVVSTTATTGDVLLAQVVSYEDTIARDQEQIATLAAEDRNHAVGGRGGVLGDASDPVATARAVAASEQTTSADEYAFFTRVGRDPVQSAELVGATAHQAATVRQAIGYNVQAVQAQVAQEAAITQAAVGTSPFTPPMVAGVPAAHLTTPLGGVITQPFGPTSFVIEPPLTFDGVTYPHFHTGVDIAGPLDSPIHAAADGVVALAGTETDALGQPVGYGNYVVIAHAGRMITLYGHLDHLLVHPGQVVHAGDVIGLEGSSGNSTGPHLHFEVRVGGVVTDPMQYLVPVAVR